MDYALDAQGGSFVVFIRQDAIQLIDETLGRWPPQEIGGPTTGPTRSASCAVDNGKLYVTYVRNDVWYLLIREGGVWSDPIDVLQDVSNGPHVGTAWGGPSPGFPAVEVACTVAADGRLVVFTETQGGVRYRGIRNGPANWQADLAQ
jgi:hypothetical protein